MFRKKGRERKGRLRIKKAEEEEIRDRGRQRKKEA
jgi:hypothetical protein